MQPGQLFPIEKLSGGEGGKDGKLTDEGRLVWGWEGEKEAEKGALRKGDLRKEETGRGNENPPPYL